MTLLTPCDVVNAQLAALMERGSTAEGALVQFVNELHRRWMAAKEQTPSQACADERVLVDLAAALFTNVQGEPTFTHALRPESTRAAFWALQRLFLQSEVGTNQAGQGSVINGLRYQILPRIHAFVRDEYGFPMPSGLSGEFTAHGIAYRPLRLEVRFPEPGRAALDADAEVTLLGEGASWRLPVAAITGLRRPTAKELVRPLASLHRFGRHGHAMLLFGDWYSADGFGRELAAAAIAGLAVRTGTRNNLDGVSPTYALTQAGLMYVLKHLDAQREFGHYNQIEQHTAYLSNEYATVPFDIGTGAILGNLASGDASPEQIPAAVAVDLAPRPIQSGQTYGLHDLRCWSVAEYVLCQAVPGLGAAPVPSGMKERDTLDDDVMTGLAP